LLRGVLIALRLLLGIVIKRLNINNLTKIS
jgi:hypothetical protein